MLHRSRKFESGGRADKQSLSTQGSQGTDDNHWSSNRGSQGSQGSDGITADPFVFRILSEASNPRSHYARFSPGKPGGNFALPFGGKVFISANTLKKQDTVTCRVILPHDRFKYEPITRTRHDSVSSEIFYIQTSCSRLRNPVRLQLPHLKKDNDWSQLVLLTKEQDGSPWQPVPFTDDTLQMTNNYMTFETTHLNTFYVIVSTPQREQFDVLTSGCLHTARMNRIISVRIPKTATPVDMNCTIQLLPFTLQNVPQHLAQDILSFTDFVCITPSASGELRREATIKLPLPPTRDDQQIALDGLTVYQTLTDTETWIVVNSPLKLKQNAVAFATKHLTQFCVAYVKPGREQRVCETLKLAADKLNTASGDIVPYFHIEGKVWTLWIDCLNIDKLQSTVDHIENQFSLRIVPQTSYLPCAKSTKLFKVNPKGVVSNGSPSELILTNGSAFEIEVSGDLKMAVDSLQGEEIPVVHISYHNKLEQNYCRLEVVPSSECHADGKSLTGIIRVYAATAAEDRKCVRTYEMIVDQAHVEEYYAILLLEAQAKETLEAASNTLNAQKELEKTINSHRLSEMPAKPKRDYKSAMESFERLTRPTKHLHIGISKETKVLSGRSLKVLSTVIEKGVRLAIQLNLAESAVTGLTFDSVANRMNHNEMTYRILLLWKRRTNRMSRDKQVGMLTNALRGIGQPVVANIVAEQYERKEEITEGCFERTEDSGDETSSSTSPPTCAPPSSRRASACEARNGDNRRVSEDSITHQRRNGNITSTRKTRLIELRLPSI